MRSSFVSSSFRNFTLRMCHFALIDEHEAMLKRIRRKGKTVALESANRNYETKIFGPDRVKVQGVLVSLYRNF